LCTFLVKGCTPLTEKLNYATFDGVSPPLEDHYEGVVWFNSQILDVSRMKNLRYFGTNVPMHSSVFDSQIESLAVMGTYLFEFPALIQSKLMRIADLQLFDTGIQYDPGPNRHFNTVTLTGASAMTVYPSTTIGKLWLNRSVVQSKALSYVRPNVKLEYGKEVIFVNNCCIHSMLYVDEYADNDTYLKEVIVTTDDFECDCFSLGCAFAKYTYSEYIDVACNDADGHVGSLMCEFGSHRTCVVKDPFINHEDIDDVIIMLNSYVDIIEIGNIRKRRFKSPLA